MVRKIKIFIDSDHGLLVRVQTKNFQFYFWAYAYYFCV